MFILFTITSCLRLMYLYNTTLLRGLLTGVWVLINVCIYLFLIQMTLSCNPLIYVLEINYFWHNSLTFILFFKLTFGSNMLLSCNPFLVLRKATSVEKTSVLLFDINVKINNYVMKNLFIVCLLLHRVMTTSRSPLIYIL